MKILILPIIGALLMTGCDLPESLAKASAKPVSTEKLTSASSVDVVSTNTPTSLPSLPPNLPNAAREVVNLAHAQMSDSVITSFISNLNEPFHLDADQVVYLRDLGLSSTVLEALLVKETQLGPPDAIANDPTGSPSMAAAPSQTPSSTNATASISPNYPGATPALQAPQVGPAQQVATQEPAPQQPGEMNNNYFYDALAPYGSWTTVPNYGNVWQPSCAVVTPGWRPYWNNGSWSWSDCGWYWNSSYSWGWAPFHYGNWVNAPGAGWCWVPGNCWGPSWVTFRSSPGYCGWAPLPPGCGWSSGVGLTWAGSGVSVGFGFGFGAAAFCWTPARCFTGPNCWNNGVSGTQVNQLYQNSTVINNYVVGNNNTIINGGIDPKQIQPYTRSEIRKVQLTDVQNPNAATGSAAAAARPGQSGVMPVYRPTVTAAGRSSGAANARGEARPTLLASSAPATSSRLPSRPSVSGAESVNARNGAVSLLSNRPGTGSAPVTTGNTLASRSVNRPTGGSVSSQPAVPNPGPQSRANVRPPTSETPSLQNQSARQLEPRKAPTQGATYPGANAPQVSQSRPITAPASLQPGAPAQATRPTPSYQAPAARTPMTSPSYQAPAYSQQGSAPRPATQSYSAPGNISASRPSYNSSPSYNGGSRGGNYGSSGGSSGSLPGRPGRATP